MLEKCGWFSRQLPIREAIESVVVRRTPSGEAVEYCCWKSCWRALFKIKWTIRRYQDLQRVHVSGDLSLFTYLFLTYLYRMTISVIVTAINMGPVFTTQRTATTPGTSHPTLF